MTESNDANLFTGVPDRCPDCGMALNARVETTLVDGEPVGSELVSWCPADHCEYEHTRERTTNRSDS